MNYIEEYEIISITNCNSNRYIRSEKGIVKFLNSEEEGMMQYRYKYNGKYYENDEFIDNFFCNMAGEQPDIKIGKNIYNQKFVKVRSKDDRKSKSCTR